MRFLLQARRYSLPFRVPLRTAHGPWIQREGLFVRVESESGAAGYGEAAPVPGFGTESVEADEAALRRLGATPSEQDIEGIPAELGCLRGALAAALESLSEGRAGPLGPPKSNNARGGPSGPALPALPRESDRYLPVAALLPAGKAAFVEIRPKMDAGFRTFKWKVGVGDIAEELGLLDDLCGVLPEGAQLRLDANGAWNRKQAERWLERCAERPVEFVEQPCFALRATQGEALHRKTDDLLRGLAEDFPTPIALDESIAADGDIALWIDAGWPGVFVIKPSLHGDLGAARERLKSAMDRVVFSSALETGIGAQAALRIAFAWTCNPRTGDQGRSSPAREGREHSPVPNDAAIRPDPAAHAAGHKKPPLALGFGVWPLFVDGRFNGPYAAPFLYERDIHSIDAEALWNALS